MNTALPLLVICPLLFGCATTIDVRVDESRNNDRILNLEQVNERITGSTVTIFCSGGTTYRAEGVHLAADSTRFVEAGSLLGRTIATRDIMTLRRINHGTGAVTGALLGSAAGLLATVGILVATSYASGDHAGGGLVLLAGCVGGGAILGGLIGAETGSREDFQISVPARR